MSRITAASREISPASLPPATFSLPNGRPHVAPPPMRDAMWKVRIPPYTAAHLMGYMFAALPTEEVLAALPVSEASLPRYVDAIIRNTSGYLPSGLASNGGHGTIILPSGREILGMEKTPTTLYDDGNHIHLITYGNPGKFYDDPRDIKCAGRFDEDLSFRDLTPAKKRIFLSMMRNIALETCDSSRFRIVS